jgi:hypothetical protein
MDLQTRKLEFIQEFLKVQSEDVVDRLEKLLKKENSKLDKEDIQPFSMDELNHRINQSMVDSQNNKLTESDDILAEVQKWD